MKGAPNVDFARQLAEQNAQQKQKKFRSSAAPKGSKLPQGYQDRARERESESSTAQDDREARIRALEEQMKLQQIDRATFERLRDQITDGDVGATHLVKGLDRQLLERVRRGENVMSGPGKNLQNWEERKPEQLTPDADEEFEKLEQREVVPFQKEETNKKGRMGSPRPAAGVKRSRSEVLAELKATREAAQKNASSLGSRFRKVGRNKESGSRIERDDKGREVLITVDADGNVKRKVRKIESSGDKKKDNGLLMPDKDATPLGMEVPEHARAALQNQNNDEDDGDIFEGVGDEYDPLKDKMPLSESEDDSSDEDGQLADKKKKAEDINSKPTLEPEPNSQNQPHPSPSSSSAREWDVAVEAKVAMPPPPLPTTVKRNYFNDNASSHDNSENKASTPFSDPTILATLKRAAALDAASVTDEEGEQSKADRNPKPTSAAQRLLQRDRDYDDMDMGFGSSRFGDEEDAEDGGKKVKLSEWKGMGVEDDGNAEGGQRGSSTQRKRGKRKRKGDKNSASDVLRVIEGRKGGGG